LFFKPADSDRVQIVETNKAHINTINVCKEDIAYLDDQMACLDDILALLPEEGFITAFAPYLAPVKRKFQVMKEKAAVTKVQRVNYSSMIQNSVISRPIASVASRATSALERSIADANDIEHSDDESIAND
jgi:hypothetical protein